VYQWYLGLVEDFSEDSEKFELIGGSYLNLIPKEIADISI